MLAQGGIATALGRADEHSDYWAAYTALLAAQAVPVVGEKGGEQPGLLQGYRVQVLMALTVYITLHRVDGECEDCAPGVACHRFACAQRAARMLIRRRHGVRPSDVGRSS